jgi:hypothetical protein
MFTTATEILAISSTLQTLPERGGKVAISGCNAPKAEIGISPKR